MNVRARRHGFLPMMSLIAAVAVFTACDDSNPAAPELDQEMSAFQTSAFTAQNGATADASSDEREHDRPTYAKFGGLASLRGVTGTEPNRVAHIEVTRSNRGMNVDLIEGTTVFAQDGDLNRFGEVLAALESDVRLRIQGEGRIQDNGAIGALRAKVQILDHDGSDHAAASGLATLVSLSGQSPNQVMLVHLVNPRTDRRIPVAILERSTVFAAGDLNTFGRLLDAFRADVRVWISARGERNDEGVLVASTVAVEIAAGGNDRDRDRDRDRTHDRTRDSR